LLPYAGQLSRSVIGPVGQPCGGSKQIADLVRFRLGPARVSSRTQIAQFSAPDPASLPHRSMFNRRGWLVPPDRPALRGPEQLRLCGNCNAVGGSAAPWGPHRARGACRGWRSSMTATPAPDTAGGHLRGRPRYVRNQPWLDVDVPNKKPDLRLVTSVVGGEMVKRVGFVLFGGQLCCRVVSRRECPRSSATTTKSVWPRSRLVANMCLRTWAVGSSSSAACSAMAAMMPPAARADRRPPLVLGPHGATRVWAGSERACLTGRSWRGPGCGRSSSGRHPAHRLGRARPAGRPGGEVSPRWRARPGRAGRATRISACGASAVGWRLATRWAAADAASGQVCR
jgi:hypothetical protein